MARKCEICGKDVVLGNRFSHSNKKNSRKLKPNLHKITVIVNGRKRKVNVCTKCSRKLPRQIIFTIELPSKIGNKENFFF
ncbi:MAG: 50S ribosomal protein L28 [Candidatus Hydrothermia bacterium]|jgi:large subunit ribosomal protein L28|nr:50S ribosomal protein L28 [Candidatus Hydrothermia bacterium]